MAGKSAIFTCWPHARGLSRLAMAVVLSVTSIPPFADANQNQPSQQQQQKVETLVRIKKPDLPKKVDKQKPGQSLFNRNAKGWNDYVLKQLRAGTYDPKGPSKDDLLGMDRFIPDIQAIDKIQIEATTKLDKILNQLRFQGVPGFPYQKGGFRSEAEELEEQFLRWRNLLQSVLARSSYADVPPMAKRHPLTLNLIIYFNALLALAQLHVHNETFFDLHQWSTKMAIRFSPNKISHRSMLGDLAEIAQGREDFENPMLVELKSSPPQAMTYVLRLKPWLASNLFEVYLAQQPHKEAVVSFSQFLTANLVYDNLTRLYVYNQKSWRELPDIPREIVSKFPVLAQKKRDKVEEWTALLREKWQEELLRLTADLFKAVNQEDRLLINDLMMAELANLNPPEGVDFVFGDEEFVVEGLKALRTEEIDRALIDFQLLVVSRQLTLRRDHIAAEVIELIAEAKALAIRNAIIGESSLNPRKKQSRIDIIEKWKAQYIAKLRTHYSDWIAPVLAKGNFIEEGQFLKEARDTFFNKLFVDGQDIERLSDSRTANLRPDMAMLYLSMAASLRKAGVSGKSLGLYKEIFNQDTYQKVRDKYLQTLAGRLSQFSIPNMPPGTKVTNPNGLTEPAHLRQLLNITQWSNPVNDQQIKSKNPLTSKWAAKAAEDRKKETLDLVTIGEKFGFFGNDNKGETILSDLKLDSETLKLYRETILKKALAQHPILSMTLEEFPLTGLPTNDISGFGELPNYNENTISASQAKLARVDQSTAFWEHLTSRADFKVSGDLFNHYIAQQLNMQVRNLEFLRNQFRTSENNFWNSLFSNTPAGEQFKRMTVTSAFLAGRLRSHPNLGPLRSEIMADEFKPELLSRLWKDFYTTYAEQAFMVFVTYQGIRWLMKYANPFKIKIPGLTRMANKTIDLRSAAGFLERLEAHTLGPYMMPFIASGMAMISYHYIYEEPRRVWFNDLPYRNHVNDLAKGNTQGPTLFNLDEAKEIAAQYNEDNSRTLMGTVGTLSAALILPAIMFFPHFGVPMLAARRLESATSSLAPTLEQLGMKSSHLNLMAFYEANLEARGQALVKSISESNLPAPVRLQKIAETRQAIAQLQEWVAKESRYWQVWGERLKHHFELLGLKPGHWDPFAIYRVQAEIVQKYQAGQMGREEYRLARHAVSKLIERIEGVIKVIQSGQMRGEKLNPVQLAESKAIATAFYARVWRGTDKNFEAAFEGVGRSRYAGEWTPENLAMGNNDPMQPGPGTKTLTFEVQTTKAQFEGGEVKDVEVLVPRWNEPLPYNKQWQEEIMAQHKSPTEISMVDEVGGHGDVLERYTEYFNGGLTKRGWLERLDDRLTGRIHQKQINKTIYERQLKDRTGGQQ